MKKIIRNMGGKTKLKQAKKIHVIFNYDTGDVYCATTNKKLADDIIYKDINLGSLPDGSYSEEINLWDN